MINMKRLLLFTFIVEILVANSYAFEAVAETSTKSTVSVTAPKLESKAVPKKAPQASDCFPEDKSKETIIQNCTACHSAMLVCQQRMSRDRWDETITWMQEEEQGLWEFEPKTRKEILDYLEKYLGPEKKKSGALLPPRVAPLISP